MLEFECVHNYPDSRRDPEDHVAAVSHHHPHRAEQGGEGVGEQDVDHAHEGHHPGVSVNLTICHHSPGKTLSDPVNGKKQDEETLRPQEIRTKALTQRSAAINMEDEVRVRVAKENDDES